MRDLIEADLENCADGASDSIQRLQPPQRTADPPSANGCGVADGPAKVPEKLKCDECTGRKPPNQTWWCRTCLKIICAPCNLLKGHTSHRSSLWSAFEMAQSLVNLQLGRKAARMQKSAEEEIAIREYMSAVERHFVEKLHRLVDEQSQRDAEMVALLCDALRFDPKGALLPKTPWPSDNAAILSISRALEDSKFERLLKQIDDLLLDGERLSTSINKTTVAPHFSNFDGKFYVLPHIEPEKFAERLENEATASSRSTLLYREHTGNGRKFSGPKSSARSSSVDVSKQIHETELDSASEKATASAFPQPIEPGISVAQEKLAMPNHAGDAADFPDCLIMAGSSVDPFDQTSEVPRGVLVPQRPTDKYSSEINAAKSLDNDRQMDPPYHVVSPVPSAIRRSSFDLTPGVLSLPGRSLGDRFSSQGDNASNLSLAGLSIGGDRVNVTAYNFGDSFLTRPVDVCILPGRRLAVSDSLAGVYVLTWTGDVLQRLKVDGASVSSLAYSYVADRLFIGVLRKEGRSVQVHDASSLELCDTLPCPEQPRVETSRSRWLCVTPRGHLYAASGDNTTSALWLWSPVEHRWITVHISRGTRYQYLTFVEQTDSQLSTFVTCDCANNSLRLLTTRGDRLLRDVGFERFYDLRPYVHSPASARRDDRGNLLLVDYGDDSGKVFALEAPPSSPGADRRLKVLAEVGAREGMGIAASDGWCFVACLNKRHIKAIKYAEV